jgi:integral membrane protein
MELKSPLGRLRLLALLEGISFLLFAVTMPLKYMMGITEPNFYVGITHGWLFILYIATALHTTYIHRWGLKNTFYVLLASLVPFGTFVADARILKPIYSQA